MAVPNTGFVFRLQNKVLPSVESQPKSIVPLNLGKKLAGKRVVGKPPAALDEEVDGNGVKER